MDRVGCWSWPRRRVLAAVLAGLVIAAPGCAGMSARREGRPFQRPPMLGRRAAPAASDTALAQNPAPGSDPVADRLRVRPAQAGLLAAQPAPAPAPAPAPEASATPSQAVVTRSTAPPPGAVTSAVEPVSVPVPAPVDLEPLPPLEMPVIEPVRPPSQLVQIRSLVDEARAKLAPVKNYSVTMTRQERVGETLLPEETVVLSIRREPRAVRLEWREGPNAGREVLYSAAPDGGQMHIRMPNNPLMPRMTLPPDSPLALRNSRHPITEAGLDAVLARLDESVALHEKGRGGAERLTYEGLRTPVPGGPPCHTIQRVTATGETWIVALDAKTHLPLLVQETAPDGSLLERYVFRDPKVDLPELATAAAFDPDARWGPSQSLLSRLAGTAATEASATR